MKFYWPIWDESFITQHFGEHPEIYAQFGQKGHNGLDFHAPTGTWIRATHDGFVTFRQDKNPDGTFKGFGNYATVTNEWGSTYYAHFMKFEGINRQVKAGDVMGYSDSTGFSYDPHLHFGFRPINPDMNNGYGGCVDPLKYLADKQEKPNMSNVIFGHKTGSSEYGFWVPATTVETLKDKALNFGLNITKSDGSVDFGQAKEINGL